MTHPIPVGKRGSLLFSVILEPSDTESEIENVEEDIKEENVEVTIFEKIKLVFPKKLIAILPVDLYLIFEKSSLTDWIFSLFRI